MPIKGRRLFFGCMLLGELPRLMPFLVCALFFGVPQASAAAPATGVRVRMHP